jgi:hypothetical protein
MPLIPKGSRGILTCLIATGLLTLLCGQGCPAVFPAALNTSIGASVNATPLLQTGETGSAAASIWNAVGPPSYAWTITAPGEIVGSATDLVVTFKANAPGTITLAVTVTDSGTGIVVTSSAEVQVVGPAEPPESLIADAGPDQTVQVGSTILLNGSASGGVTDGWSLYGYMWRQVSGPFQNTAPDFVSESQAITVIGTTPGEAVFALIAQDQSGATAMDTVKVTVTANPG